MRALRLVIHQSSANYKREETVENKMTYPLPPFSTVIGALHNACGYHEYRPMDISIQGRYRSMRRKPYTDFCFLNSTQDDRGTLVKMRNAELLSSAFEEVASAKKPQGNSFRNGITIQVHNEELLEEYRKLKDLNDEILQFKKERLGPLLELLKRRKKTLSDKKKNLEKGSPDYVRVEKREKEIKRTEKEIKERVEKEYRKLKDLNDEILQFKKERLGPLLELLKRRKKTLSDKKKNLEKGSPDYVRVEKREKEIKRTEKEIKERVETFQREQYAIPISKFRTLTKSMKFYEILDDIELIIHVRASDEVLNDIYEHRFDIKSIGRSEDFVTVKEARIVELTEENEDGMESDYSAYIDCEMIKQDRVFPQQKGGTPTGTKYFLNKNYEIVEGKRYFEKKKVLYVSGYAVETFGNGLYLDSEGGKNYIVNFL